MFSLLSLSRNYGHSLQFNSARLGRDVWVGKLGFNVQPNMHWSVSALYEGHFVLHRQENTGKVELKYSL